VRRRRTAAEVKVQAEAPVGLNLPVWLKHLYLRTRNSLPHQKRIYALLKADEATQLDGTIGVFKSRSSWEFFSAQLEPELGGQG